MAPFKTGSFAVRPWSRTLLVGSLAGLLALPGCSHRRTALRPVYGTPASVVAPATIVSPEGCPAGATISTTPDSSEPFLSRPSVPASPATSAAPDSVIRAGVTPPAAAPADEPNFMDLTPVNPTSGTSTRPRSSINTNAEPELTRPSTYRPSARQPRVSSRATKVSLGEAVRPYLANPDDLFHPPKADRPWKYVVLHHSANATGGYDQIDRDHRKLLGFDGCGYHFVIGNGTDSPDGEIEVADRWLNQKNGVHCKNGKTSDVNEYGIGICLIGNFDQARPTPRQVAAARALVAYLEQRYAVDADHVGTHDQFSTGTTSCPGKNFPTEAILGHSYVAAR